MDFKNLKVAIVCDWLTGIGGAERVVKSIHDIFPEAPIYTSQYDPAKIDWFKDAEVRTGFLNHLPVSLKKFLPVLRFFYFNNLDLSDYDLVISSSGAEAKGVKTGKNTIHICYMHAPTHYYWSRYNQYLKHPGMGKLDPLARFGLKTLVTPLRKWDKAFSKRPDFIIANSTHTQSEIMKYYNRESFVIFPPVELNRFKNTYTKKSGFVVTGRQTPYKKIDLAVRASKELNEKLTVIGNGPDHQKLLEIADGNKNITFVTNASDKEVADYLKKAKGFIFAGIDDFGIAPVEALASGTPVIAFNKGGALDYIKNKENGILFNKQNVETLKEAIKEFNTLSFNQQKVAKTADRFSEKQFKDNIIKFIKDCLNKK